MIRHFSNSIVTALLLTVWFSVPAPAQTEELDELFEQLKSSTEESWQGIEEKIWFEWSRSGSPSMDLLLQRGRTAMEEGDTSAAIEHFTALVDHAPDFAEGYNARATAYFQAGLYGPSLEDIRRALMLNPRHFGAMAGLALILEELDYPKDALAAYREVQSIHPHRPNVSDAIERLEKQTGGETL